MKQQDTQSTDKDTILQDFCNKHPHLSGKLLDFILGFQPIQQRREPSGVEVLVFPPVSLGDLVEDSDADLESQLRSLREMIDLLEKDWQEEEKHPVDCCKKPDSSEHDFYSLQDYAYGKGVEQGRKEAIQEERERAKKLQGIPKRKFSLHTALKLKRSSHSLDFIAEIVELPEEYLTRFFKRAGV
ncbi:MAG: hypothetical protein AAF518_01360 [Spirochaetota bacterium]